MVFNLEKGSKFQLAKGLQRATATLSWDAPDTVGGQAYDPDASIFGLVYLPGGVPKFYNDGTHAVTYANPALKQADRSFKTADGSLRHSGDNKTGGDEVISIDFGLIPAEIRELAIWVTIHQGDDASHPRNHRFGQMSNAKIVVSDSDNGTPLCEYKLGSEFADAFSVQVGSFFREENNWVFKAIGAGSSAVLKNVLDQYN